MLRAILLLSLALLCGCAATSQSRDGPASYDFGLARTDKSDLPSSFLEDHAFSRFCSAAAKPRGCAVRGDEHLDAKFG